MTFLDARRTAALPVLVGALASVFALGSGCGRGDDPGDSRPNLLLVTIDTLRADRLACYGGEAGVGEAICAVAERGTRFRWAFAAAPYTAPSIASLLTSVYPSSHGVSQSAVSYLDEEAITLAEVLQAAGYTTAAFVSNPVLERSRHLHQGFATYDHRMTRSERNRKGFQERAAEQTTDATLAWAEVAATEPWFLWVHYQDPHGPYEPPEPGPPPADGGTPLPLLDDDSGHEGIPRYQALAGVRGPVGYEHRYADEIRYLDGHLARLIAGLDALGRPPAILLTSDHGEAFGEDDYYFAHGHSVGLDQIRVPLLWRPVEPTTPSVRDELASTLDVAPTLLRVAGVEPPTVFAGRPLPVAGLDTPPPPAERSIFAEHARRAAVLREGRYFARDRWPLDGSEVDRVTGGRHLPLPARSAVLGSSDALPAYTTAAEPTTAALEPVLARWIDRPTAQAPTHEDVPEESRERLRALGYLD